LKYEFDRQINRYNTASMKWDDLESIYGEKDVLPMWVADMDFMCPPPVLEVIKNRAEHGILGYTTQPRTYFEAFMCWIRTRFNWEIKKEWIHYSPGLIPGLNYLVQAFTKPGDKIVIQPPVYHHFANVIVNNGRQVVYNQLHFDNGRYEIDFSDLGGKLRDGHVKMLILCSPHNPVGRVWNKEELTVLGNICLDNKVLVVSDEIHADLMFQGAVHTPFASICEEFAQNSIVCTAPSKTFNMAGLQTSNLIIPNPEHGEIFRAHMKTLHLLRPNMFGILATECAYKYGSEWVEQLLEYLQQNLNFLLRYFEDNIKRIRVIKPEGTYLIWLDCRELGMKPKQLEEFMLKQAKVAMDDGYIFGPGGEGFTRINIACPRSVLEEGLSRIAKAVDGYCRTS
jgi:cystathionine beta-lyase